jgi:hypothetical protein
MFIAAQKQVTRVEATLDEKCKNNFNTFLHWTLPCAAEKKLHTFL